MRGRPGWIWAGRAVAALVVAGLAAYLSIVGLDKADKLAGVLSLFVVVVALVAPYVFPPAAEQSSVRDPAQSVTDSLITGSVTQVRVTRASTRSADATREGHDGQQVSGTWVGGNLTQFDGADAADSDTPDR